MPNKELNEAQIKSALTANRTGFLTHALALGKSEKEAVAMFKTASARNDRQEKLAKTIRDNLAGK